MSINNQGANGAFRGVSSSYSINSRNIFFTDRTQDNNIIDYDLLVRKKLTVGEVPEKDMDHAEYTDEFDPFLYQSELFPGMSNLQESNIMQGDKTEQEKLQST